MIIGIDASRAFSLKKTGIEQYSYHILKHLKNILVDKKVILYLKPGQDLLLKKDINFNTLPQNWEIKIIFRHYFWTQIGLSWEIWKNSIDVLFIPAHILPFYHPSNSILTIHGLEYEITPKSYSWLARVYLHWSLKKSSLWAKKIIAVSQNTKSDLISFYKIPSQKIKVIYEGFSLLSIKDKKNEKQLKKKFLKKWNLEINKKFLLFIGRIEERKNILNIIKAFQRIKKEKKFKNLKLVLAGGQGHNYKKIIKYIEKSLWNKDIILTGYVSEEEKNILYSSASLFLFPSLYEGFGLPVLEAQALGTPVITSNLSSLPEIVDKDFLQKEKKEITDLKNQTKDNPHQSALLVDPYNSQEIAQAIKIILNNPSLQKTLIQRGKENIQRFSWKKTAQAIAQLIQKETEKD